MFIPLLSQWEKTAQEYQRKEFSDVESTDSEEESSSDDSTIQYPKPILKKKKVALIPLRRLRIPKKNKDDGRVRKIKIPKKRAEINEVIKKRKRNKRKEQNKIKNSGLEAKANESDNILKEPPKKKRKIISPSSLPSKHW